MISAAVRLLSALLAALTLSLGAAQADDWGDGALALAKRIEREDLVFSQAKRDALEAAAQEAEGEALLAAMNRIMGVYAGMSDNERVAVWAERLALEAERQGSRRYADIARLFQALVRGVEGDLIAAIEDSEEIVGQSADWLVQAKGARVIAYLSGELGRYQKALAALDAGFAALVATEPLAGEAEVGLQDAMAFTLMALGDSDGALKAMARVIDLSIANDIPADGVTAVYNLAQLAGEQRRWPLADALAEIEHRLGERSGLGVELFFSDYLCAGLDHAADDFAGALACADAALAAEATVSSYVPRLHFIRANALARLGDVDAAEAAYQIYAKAILEHDSLELGLDRLKLESELAWARGDANVAIAGLRAYADARARFTKESFNAGAKELRASLSAELDSAEERAAQLAREAEFARQAIMRKNAIFALSAILLVIAVAIAVLQNQARRELAAARAAAEAANVAKTEFLASMSHELRTPLNGVLGMAQVLHGSELKPEQREQTATILESGKTLMSLLNDILDLSKIEAGKLEIAPVDDDLGHALSRVARLYEPAAREHGVTLSLEIDPAAPQRLRFDPVRVRQCVANLISNAVKFTEVGSVKVSATAVPEGERFRVTITVVDTGMGMSPETQTRLFTAFSQADASVTRRYGGTGLGLAITRRLANLMNGDVSVRSALGQGSTFELTFLADAAAVQSETAPAYASTLSSAPVLASVRGARVLVVDDQLVNRQVARLFLAPLGVELVEAGSGEQTMQILALQPIDAILMDIHLGEENGCDLARRIRTSGAAFAATPIVALTAADADADKAAWLASGMNDYAPKPLDARSLYAALARVIAPKSDALAAIA